MATDQTDSTTYTRPGVWDISVPIVPGIDTLHSFRDPGIDPKPSTIPITPGVAPMPGPSAVTDTKAPPQNSRAWWRRRNNSAFVIDSQNGDRQEVTLDTPSGEKLRGPDPRYTTIPVDRWTGRRGPELLAYLQRVSFGNFRERRFVPNPGAHMAFTPSLRPSPMAFGDGIGNVSRFRPTQRSMPVPLDQQIISTDQQNATSKPILSSGSQLSQRWW